MHTAFPLTPSVIPSVPSRATQVQSPPQRTLCQQATGDTFQANQANTSAQFGHKKILIPFLLAVASLFLLNPFGNKNPLTDKKMEHLTEEGLTEHQERINKQVFNVQDVDTEVSRLLNEKNLKHDIESNWEPDLQRFAAGLTLRKQIANPMLRSMMQLKALQQISTLSKSDQRLFMDRYHHATNFVAPNALYKFDRINQTLEKVPYQQTPETLAFEKALQKTIAPFITDSSVDFKGLQKAIQANLALPQLLSEIQTASDSILLLPFRAHPDLNKVDPVIAQSKSNTPIIFSTAEQKEGAQAPTGLNNAIHFAIWFNVNATSDYFTNTRPATNAIPNEVAEFWEQIWAINPTSEKGPRRSSTVKLI